MLKPNQQRNLTAPSYCVAGIHAIGARFAAAKLIANVLKDFDRLAAGDTK
jgi:hypothetical protein